MPPMYEANNLYNCKASIFIVEKDGHIFVKYTKNIFYSIIFRKSGIGLGNTFLFMSLNLEIWDWNESWTASLLTACEIINQHLKTLNQEEWILTGPKLKDGCQNLWLTFLERNITSSKRKNQCQEIWHATFTSDNRKN